jgi:putative ABC transport system permease protein
MSWRRFFRRARWDEERQAELRAHLDFEIDEGLARGLSMDEARTAAYRKLGNPTLIREEIYGMNTLGWLETWWQDVRYGARVLRRSPTFTIVAILSLALGVGANTAIFELISAVRLRTLPVPEPGRLVELRIDAHGKGRTGEFNGHWPRMTHPLFVTMREADTGLDHLFAWSSATFDLADGGESRPVNGLWVSGDFFSGIGVRPAAGRLLGPDDDRRGCGAPAVVVSYAFWQRQFGGDPAVAGRVLNVSGTPFTVAGVSEQTFFGLDVGRSFDVAIPICAEPLLRGDANRLERRDAWWLSVMTRLAPGQTIDTVNPKLAAISTAVMQTTLPPNYLQRERENYLQFTLKVNEAGAGVSDLRSTYAQPLWVLLVIAGAVLLIACGNLANLLLARATARAREMAVRLAIGASRRRLIRQMLVESLLLASAGAILGTAIASVLSRALVAFFDRPGEAVFVDLRLDWRVLAFTAALALLTCVICGLAPALRSTGTNPAVVMRASGRGLTDAATRFSLRRLLVVGQLALSLVLVTGALLFAATLKNVVDVDPGFRPSGILEADLDFRRADVPRDQQARFNQAFLERVQGLPGVGVAATASHVMLSGSGWNETLVVEGKEQRPFPNLSRVSRDFFRVMQMPLVAGRAFDARDTMAAPAVAVVTEAFAQAYFHEPAPLGRQFAFARPAGDYNPTVTIVGVVKDVKYFDVRDPFGPVAFFPDTQDPRPDVYMTILMRPNGDVPGAITRAAKDVHPRILVSFTKLDDQIRASMIRERLMATLSGFFALLAGGLAAIGLYGVMSYLVARRRIEIGIRMALGAERGRIIWMFLRESAWLVLAGLAIGATLAVFAARSSATLFFGLSPGQPWPFVAAATLLAIVALAAAFLPARRASRLAPTEALRGE